MAFFSFSPGCSNASKTADPNNPVILTVNGDKITAGEIKRELALRAKQDPSFKVTPAALTQQLEIVVNRRILIQEATRRKLAEEETFVNTIRNFWEQTLIRDLFNQMGAEAAKSVTVSEEEIKAYYAKLSQKVTFDIARNAQKKTVEELAEKLKQGQTIAWNEKVGPAGYEELSSPALDGAFSLGVGEYKTYQEGGIYYLVRVAAKEPAQPPALEDVRGKIENHIKQRKQQAALETWLKETRAKAKIHYEK
ncbi:MAG: hypothetical protein AUJ71_04440 [Candidatus Omnitrophica bacterium CG1_02_49_16]|nr:MAG: hypothetical protein AUJ71_04440 [Candidatus Omnitrophica bacterium CG1_02_49_16]